MVRLWDGYHIKVKQKIGPQKKSKQKMQMLLLDYVFQIGLSIPIVWGMKHFIGQITFPAHYPI